MGVREGGALAKADRYFILRIDSYEGRDTHICCGDDERDFVYVVGSLDANGNADIVDCCYRSLEEAAQAWPEAMPRRARNR